jgi:hypothetical protein
MKAELQLFSHFNINLVRKMFNPKQDWVIFLDSQLRVPKLLDILILGTIPLDFIWIRFANGDEFIT